MYQTYAFNMVRLMRFELTRHKHYRLKIARLPFRHSRNYNYYTICNQKTIFLHTLQLQLLLRKQKGLIQNY